MSAFDFQRGGIYDRDKVVEVDQPKSEMVLTSIGESLVEALVSDLKSFLSDNEQGIQITFSWIDRLVTRYWQRSSRFETNVE